MSIFRYSEPIYKQDKLFVSVCGEKEIPDYILEHPDTGGVRLKQKGTKPIYAIIQANKVNCDLASVLEQCVHQNQLAVCDMDDVTQAIADFSGLSNMSEWYAGMKHLEQTWEQMPLEAREQFGSSRVQFINQIGTPTFVSKLQDGYNAFNESVKKRLDVPGPTPSVVLTPAPEETKKGSEE